MTLRGERVFAPKGLPESNHESKMDRDSRLGGGNDRLDLEVL